MLKWFEYTQNNSGGSFVTNDKLCHRIFIEARNVDEANGFAESLGIYFDGCSSGDDCPCCGDRWSKPWDEVKMPLVYGRFSTEDAEKMAKNYGVEVRPAPKLEQHLRKIYKEKDKEVVFPTIEAYAQYLTDSYGWTFPDCRVYYHDGRVVELNNAAIVEGRAKEKKKEKKKNETV